MQQAGALRLFIAQGRWASSLLPGCFSFWSRFTAGCFASFCLPSPSLGTEPKEARPQGLN